MLFTVLLCSFIMLAQTMFFARFILRNIDSRLFPHSLWSMAISFYYGFGTLLAYSTLPREELLVIQDTAGYNDLHVCGALFFTSGFLVVLHAIAVALPRWCSFSSITIKDALETMSAGKPFVVLAVTALVFSVWQLRNLSITIQTAEWLDNNTQLSVLETLLGPSRIALLGAAAYRMASRRQRTVSFLILVLQLLFLFPTGRRQFLAAAAFAFLCSLLIEKQKARRAITVRLAAIGAVSLVSFFWFFSFRQAGYEVPNASLSERISETHRILAEGGTQSEASIRTALKANVQTRFFAVDYLAMLIANSSYFIGGASGEVLVYTIKMAIPRAFYPNKDVIINSGGEEAIAYNTFSLPRFNDEPNTVVTAAFTDFGWAGYLSVVLFLGIIAVDITLILRCRFRLLQLIGLAAFSYAMFQCEDALTAQFITMRSLLTYYIISLLWPRIPMPQAEIPPGGQPWTRGA